MNVGAPTMFSATVATWNIFGAAQTLRAMVLRRGGPDSARFTHPALSTFAGTADVLCMQELWVGESVDFFQSLPHAHRHQDSNAPRLRPPTVAGSGLGIASKWPVVSTRFEPFAPPHVSWEKIGRKGARHAHVRHATDPRIEFDVITTHMQSGYDASSATVRLRQMQQIRKLVDTEGSTARPLIVCGDFNIDGLKRSRGREYDDFRRVFADCVDLFEDEDRATFDPGSNELAARFEPHAAAQRLDYILFRAPHGDAAHQIVTGERTHAMDLPVAPNLFASDHTALTATLQWNVEPTHDGRGMATAYATAH